MTHSTITADFSKALREFKNQADWVGLRFYSEKSSHHFIRNENPEANISKRDQGVMIEVMIDGHLGYAATSDLTPDGMKAAFNKAKSLSTHAAQVKEAETPEKPLNRRRDVVIVGAGFFLIP